MNLPQYAEMEKEYKALAGGNVPGELLDPSILGPGTDWQKELFKNAAMQKHLNRAYKRFNTGWDARQ